MGPDTERFDQCTLLKTQSIRKEVGLIFRDDNIFSKRTRPKS
jgi:hypothetical protein